MPQPATPSKRRDDPAAGAGQPRPDAGGLPPDVEPQQPPPRTHRNPPNANPLPGRDSRRNRAV